MVICQYFLTNKCTFGNQCKNEHLNVKLAVKNDIDAVIKGNQWPLSCYGPFRDKPCVPNFINDQSFEEVRALCYEAKTQGNFPNVVAQLNQQILDAKNKMGYLYEFNNDVQNMIVNLHNTNDTNRADTIVRSNPFAISNTANNQTGNLFGNGSSTGNSAFGTSTPNAGAFGGASSIFGASNAVKSSAFGTTAANVFGGGQSTGVNSASVFGGGQTASVGSIFGGQQQTSAFGSAGPFSSQPAAPDTKNIFALSQLANSNPVFGAAPTFNIKPTGIFGQANASLGGGAGDQATNSASNIFGQPFGGQQVNSQQTSIFGQPAAVPVTQNLFGTPATQSVFGVSAAPSAFGTPAPQTTNVFGNPTQTQSSTSIFGAPQPNVFQQQQIQQPFGAPVSAANNFGLPASTTIQATGIFANYQQQPQQPSQTQPFQQNVFQQQQSIVQPLQPQPLQQQQPQPQPQQTQNSFTSPFGAGSGTSVFSNQTQSFPPTIASSTIYSQMADLTQEEIDQFKSNTFEIGKIPTKPPPRELCF